MDTLKAVTVTISLLMAIVVGGIVFFTIMESDETISGEYVYEEFSFSDTANASAWSVTLKYSPQGIAQTNVTCVNLTAGAESYPTFTINRMQIHVAADAADNFTQVNVTYLPLSGAIGSDVQDMGENVLTLAPIIALVIVAAVIIAVVVTIGGGKKDF